MATILINIALIGAIAVSLYVAWHVGLFECALWLGRSFFSFFIALGLSQPAADLLSSSFRIPAPYLEAAVGFVIWLAVFIVVERIARGLIKEKLSSMRFNQLLAVPARLAIGLGSGILVSGFLSLTLIMLPEVEGAYINAGAHVVGGLHRKAARLYGAIDEAFSSRRGTAEELLRHTQVRAGLSWARSQVGELKELKGEDLVNRLEKRYEGLVAPKDLEELREIIRTGGRAT